MYELKSFCLLLEFLKKQQKSNWLLVFLTPKFCVQQWKSADPTHVKKCLRRQWSQKRRVLTFLQHWPFQPFFGRRNFSLEQLLKYRALQKTKWRDSSALIILPTRRQVHQVFRRVASALKAAEKTRDFTLLFLLFFDPFLLHQKHKSWPINNWSNFFFTFCTAKIAFDCGDRVHFLQDYHQHEIPRDKAKQTGNESQKSSKNHDEFRAC